MPIVYVTLLLKTFILEGNLLGCMMHHFFFFEGNVYVIDSELLMSNII